MKIPLTLLSLGALPLSWRALEDEPAPAPSPFGAFSVSLAVEDLEASRTFYGKLGFETVEEYGGERWAILRAGDITIGLFEGMFEDNMLTFNPGWNAQAEPVEDFTDVRALQARFREAGLEPVLAIDPAAGDRGPASFVLADPDGNPILFDQHVE